MLIRCARALIPKQQIVTQLQFILTTKAKASERDS